MDTKILRSMSYGLYAVTTNDEENGRGTGCIANSVFQVTSSPAVIAACINRSNYTRDCISRSGRFAVSVLSESTPQQVIAVLGFVSGRDEDKLSRLSCVEADGLPVIRDTCGYMLCRVTGSFETETHTVFLGELTGGAVFDSDEPMTYAYYHRVRRGISPKAAPTYAPEASVSAESYVCGICGYVHEGRPPEDYICPVCGAGAADFSKKEEANSPSLLLRRKPERKML